MDRMTIGYWCSTVLFSLVLGFSAFAHFTHLEMMVESMAGLGYPLHMMTIIGFAKGLGVIAILVPGAALLKEWAYAGFLFNLIGAVASHLFVGDSIGEYGRPAFVILVGAASYLLRPASRRLAGVPSWPQANAS
jgi:hypothetical protein